MQGDSLRYKIKFSYDGTNFYGLQRQPGLRTVEDCFSKALFDINNHQETDFVASGRTDRGVHALGQVAHFDIDVDITLYKLKCALNSLLPEDIHVISTEVVDKDFHARFMVKKKKYVYVLNMGEYNPLERNYVYQYNRDLDIEKMQEGIKYFLGEHDFKNYVADDVLKPSYVRTIYDCFLEKKEDKLYFTFVGSGFMRYQVRNMVGTLLRVGMGKIEPVEVRNIFDDIEKKKLVLTAKREGLYLVEVLY